MGTRRPIRSESPCWGRTYLAGGWGHMSIPAGLAKSHTELRRGMPPASHTERPSRLIGRGLVGAVCGVLVLGVALPACAKNDSVPD